MDTSPPSERTDEPPEPGMLLGELIRLSTGVGQVLARQLGLSLSDLAALHHLVGRPPLGPVELGKHLGMSSASATVLADRLERAGYVHRRRDSTDRRRIVLEVTEATTVRTLAAVRPLVEGITAIGDRLDTTTRTTVTTYLADAAAVMKAFTDTPPDTPENS